MPLYMKLNFFIDNKIGHANITIGGSLNGEHFPPLTIGSNIEESSNWVGGIVNPGHAVLGDGGVIQKENQKLGRELKTYFFEVDSSKYEDWSKIYGLADSIYEKGNISHDWDPFAYEADGLNCMKFSENVSKYLGIRILDKIPLSVLVKTAAGSGFIDNEIRNIVYEAEERGHYFPSIIGIRRDVYRNISRKSDTNTVDNKTLDEIVFEAARVEYDGTIRKIMPEYDLDGLISRNSTEASNISRIPLTAPGSSEYKTPGEAAFALSKFSARKEFIDQGMNALKAKLGKEKFDQTGAIQFFDNQFNMAWIAEHPRGKGSRIQTDQPVVPRLNGDQTLSDAYDEAVVLANSDGFEDANMHLKNQLRKTEEIINTKIENPLTDASSIEGRTAVPPDTEKDEPGLFESIGNGWDSIKNAARNGTSVIKRDGALPTGSIQSFEDQQPAETSVTNDLNVANRTLSEGETVFSNILGDGESALTAIEVLRNPEMVDGTNISAVFSREQLDKIHKLDVFLIGATLGDLRGKVNIWTSDIFDTEAGLLLDPKIQQRLDAIKNPAQRARLETRIQKSLNQTHVDQQNAQTKAALQYVAAAHDGANSGHVPLAVRADLGNKGPSLAAALDVGRERSRTGQTNPDAILAMRQFAHANPEIFKALNLGDAGFVGRFAEDEWRELIDLQNRYSEEPLQVKSELTREIGIQDRISQTLAATSDGPATKVSNGIPRQNDKRRAAIYDHVKLATQLVAENSNGQTLDENKVDDIVDDAVFDYWQANRNSGLDPADQLIRQA